MRKILQNRPGLRRFFKTLFRSLNPFSYEDLIHESSVYYSYKYLAGLLLFAVLIMAIVGVQSVLNFPQGLDKQLDKFNSLSIDVSFDTKEPILFPGNNPKLIMDSQGNRSSIDDRLVYITPTKLEVKPKPCVWFKPACIYYNIAKQTEVTDLTGYSDVLKNRDWYKKLAYKLFLLLVPGILVLYYIFFGAKYLILTALAAVLGLLICRLIRYEVYIRDVFKVAIYSVTLMALVELITVPLQIDLFNLQYAVYLFYFIFGLSRVGFFVRGPKKGEPNVRRMHQEYVMLE